MSMFSEHGSKASLLSDSDTECGTDSYAFEERRHSPRPEGTWWSWSWLATTTSLICVFFVTRYYYTHPTWTSRLEMADLYSPLYKNFHPLSIHKSAVGDELWPDPSNIYRQDPSPAVDEAWENLTHPQYLLATEQDLIRMGKNISTAVRWPEEPDKFLMNLHVYHVMHCLNVLRKNAWQNFPYYFDTDPGLLNPGHWIHWSHCLETIRRELMCRPSMHLNTVVWQEGQSAPFFDFHVEQMCVQWEEFERMTTRAAVPHEDVKDMMTNTRKPKGAIERPTPAEGLEIFTKNHEWLMMVREQGLTLTGDHED